MAFYVKSYALLPASLRGCIHSNLFIPVRGLIKMPVEWKRPDRLYFHDPIKTGDGVDRLELDMTKLPIEVEKSKEIEKFVLL